jgi:hypothetical protein
MVFNRCCRIQIKNRFRWNLWKRFSVVTYNWRKYIYYHNGLQKALPLTLYENGFFTSQNLGVVIGLKCCSVLINKYNCVKKIIYKHLWVLINKYNCVKKKKNIQDSQPVNKTIYLTHLWAEKNNIWESFKNILLVPFSWWTSWSSIKISKFRKKKIKIIHLKNSHNLF